MRKKGWARPPAGRYHRNPRRPVSRPLPKGDSVPFTCPLPGTSTHIDWRRNEDCVLCRSRIPTCPAPRLQHGRRRRRLALFGQCDLSPSLAFDCRNRRGRHPAFYRDGALFRRKFEGHYKFRAMDLLRLQRRQHHFFGRGNRFHCRHRQHYCQIGNAAIQRQSQSHCGGLESSIHRSVSAGGFSSGQHQSAIHRHWHLQRRQHFRPHHSGCVGFFFHRDGND